MQRERLIRIAKIVAVTLAAIATVDGVITALFGQLYATDLVRDGSIDFQWSPSRVLLEGTNPFQLFLELDAKGMAKGEGSPFILGQRASYPASSLILLWPWAIFEWPVAKTLWLVTNLLAAGAIVLGLIRLAELETKGQYFWLAVLFASGLPFRHTLGNGQHGIFCLAVFIWAVLWADRNKYIAGILLAFSWVKYTITMPLSLFFLTSKSRIMILSICVSIHVALTLFGSFWISSPVIDTLIDPLRVASVSRGNGDLDIYSMVERLGYAATGLPVLFSILILGLTIITVLRVGRTNDFELLVFLALVFYILPRHKAYDLVVLVVPLAFVIKNHGSVVASIIGCLIFLMWYGRKGMEIVGDRFLSIEIPFSAESITYILTGVSYYATTLLVMSLLLLFKTMLLRRYRAKRV